jgi:ABC-2 type transport system ATP-binding protein
MLALNIRDLSFAWGRRPVLSAVSLQVSRGEHVALLGPNGSGKSTLLALIAGLAPAPEDTVTWHFDGHSAAAPGSIAARARIGVVFQNPSLDQTLSSRENLALAAEMAGLPRAEARRRVAALLELAEVADRADERVRTLSGGMRRRVDLARALVSDPEVLLLDEPTVGLDHPSFLRFWERIAEVRAARGLTVVCATHRPDEAERSDRLVMLSRGRVVHTATPEATLRAIGRDVLAVTTEAPAEAAATLDASLGLTTRVLDGRTLIVEVPAGTDGASLVVRVVGALAPGRCEAISLRRPNLGDAFLKLAGDALEAPAPTDLPARR